MNHRLLFGLMLLGLGLIGCAAGTGGQPLTAQNALPFVRQASGSGSQKLQHIIVIVQENRSLENFFAGFTGANAPTFGCALPSTGAHPRHAFPVHTQRRTGTTSDCPQGDLKVSLSEIGFTGPDLQHDWRSSITSWDHGKMDGFSQIGPPGTYEAYDYVNPQVIAPYWTMAQQYVLADEMFPTEFGGSFTAHLLLIAGTDTIDQAPVRSEVDFPDGSPDDCDSPAGTKSSYLTVDRKEHLFVGPFPCFNQFNTIAEVMDQAGVSWKYYATKLVRGGIWAPFEAIKYVRYGPDWTRNIVVPQTTILTDAENGNLAAVNFVQPSHQDSDHPGDGDGGPSWVSSIVNAVGNGPDWDSSAIIVLWDDYGGWYDNAVPQQLDYRGLGIRVPCLIISPYAKQGYVSHVQYEFASILSFIEEVYGLPRIGKASQGYTDARAASLDDAFNFNQAPRLFQTIPSKYPIQHFLHEPPLSLPLDNE